MIANTAGSRNLVDSGYNISVPLTLYGPGGDPVVRFLWCGAGEPTWGQIQLFVLLGPRSS